MMRKLSLFLVSVLVMVLMSSAVYAKTLRVGMGDPLDSDQGAFALRFKEIVEGLSNGNVTVELFPNGALGTETEMLQNARMGTLDIAIVGVGNAVPFVKELGALSMPYLLQTPYDVAKVTTGELNRMWNEYAIKNGGFKIIGWTYSNFRFITNSKRPIKTLADVKGLKIRVPHNQIILETFKAWGANPVPMDWSETFTALQQGVLDGQENPYIVNYTSKFHEVQKYLTEVHYQYSLQPMIIGIKTFDKMDKELQAIVLQAALEAQMYGLLFQTLEAGNAKAGMQAGGIEVSMLEDEEEWKKIAIETVWPKMYDAVGGKEVVEKVQKVLNKK